MGFNSLIAAPPYSRAELYELWFRQELFDKKFVFRIGKSVPTYDFDNVLRAVPLQDRGREHRVDLQRPVHARLTSIRRCWVSFPATTTRPPGSSPRWCRPRTSYLQYGFFDGNLARGVQTGLRWAPLQRLLSAPRRGRPRTGRSAQDKKPGKFGAGGWFQTGKLMGLGGATGQRGRRLLPVRLATALLGGPREE